MEDILENKLICRICLKVVDQSKQSYGNIEDDTGTLRDMMFCCIPEMDIYVSVNPILCFPCIQSLVALYNFKTKCINTETIIRSYMQRNKIEEFGTVNLTSVVRDLIHINKLQRELQQKRALEAKQNMVIAQSMESNRFIGRTIDDISDVPSSQFQKSLDRVAVSEENQLNENSQVSQKLPEENDSCQQNVTMLPVDSVMSEVPPDKKNVEQSLSPHSELGYLATKENSESSNSNLLPSVLANSASDSSLKSVENLTQNLDMNVSSTEAPVTLCSEVVQTSESIRPNSNSQLTCSEISQEVSVKSESSQNSKPYFKLHRPFFDIPEQISEVTPLISADNSKENSEVPNPNSLSRPNSTAPQQNLINPVLSRPNSVSSHGSTPLPSVLNTGDQKEFDIFSSFDQNNGQAENSNEFKNLDSEISQIIDQLGNDLAKEGDAFTQMSNKSLQGSASQDQHTQINFQSPSVAYHSQSALFPEMGQQIKQSLQIRPQIGHNISQISQQTSRTIQSPSDINQFSQMGQSSSHHMGQSRPVMMQNPSQMQQNSSHIGHNPNMMQNPLHRVHYSHSQMGNNSPQIRSHLNSNLPQMGSNQSQIGSNVGQIGFIPGQVSSNPTHNQLGSSPAQFGSNSSHMGMSSQMGLNRIDTGQNTQYQHQMGQYQSHTGQHPYQMRQYHPQTGHPSQRRHLSEMGHHSQLGHHSSQMPRQFPQAPSQFPNISNHLRNGPQMGYVSSNMANALAQMGQVPSEYNQMSPQMRYLRMQLQMRHGSPSMGASPHQLGHRLPSVEGWTPQVRTWLPPTQHDSSQRKFNYPPTQVGQDSSQYRSQVAPPSYHGGYGSSQMNQGPPTYGQYSHHINQTHSQMGQNNSQFGHPQNEHYINRGTHHYSQVSPSQSPSITEMHQRSLQQTPTPPSRSPLESLPPHNRSGMFSPPNFDGFSSPESYSNGEIKKSNSPLTMSKSPDLGIRYGDREHWKMNSFNFRGSNSPVPQITPPQMNTQIRFHPQHMGMAPPHFRLGSEHVAMPPPQTNVLPKDHLAQRMRLNSGTYRPEYSHLDNYHSPSDESINSLLVDLPPIESPVVPLSVQIKPLGTLDTVQQHVDESQETSEVMSSVKNDSASESTEIEKNTEVQNGSESVEMKEESSINAESKKGDNSDKEVSDSEVVTISKDDIYRDTDEEENSMQSNSASNSSIQKGSLQESSIENMETEQIVLPTENHKLPQEPTSNNILSMNYQCFNCPFVTDSSEEFLSHRNTCKDVKEKTEHKCPHCHYVTTRRYVLTQHINSQHTKEIWYQCPDCDYKCTDKSYLKRHSKIHVEGNELDEKVCEYCDFRTLSEYNFRKHLSKHDIQVLQCEFCSYSSNDRTNFRRHLFTHNPVPSDCDFCDYKSVSPYHMRNHLKKYHNGVGVEDLDLRKDQPIMELVDEIRAAVKDANQIRV